MLIVLLFFFLAGVFLFGLFLAFALDVDGCRSDPGTCYNGEDGYIWTVSNKTGQARRTNSRWKK